MSDTPQLDRDDVKQPATPTVRLPFDRAEYDARIAKTRRAMEKAQIDLLIVTDPTNMAWLTGYDGWSFYVHQCVLLALDGEPVWYGRGQDANGALRTVFMKRDNIIGYPDHYVQSTERHAMDYLAREVIEARGWQARRIGVEMDNYYFSAAAYASLQRNLPKATWRDATALVNWQRAVKSPREIEYMRVAARIVEKMQPGMRKSDLVAQIYSAGITGVDGYGGDYPAIVPLLPTGADAAAPHLTWDDKPFAANAGTFFEIAGCFKRDHCPQSARCISASRRSISSMRRRRWSKASKWVWRRRSRAIPAKTSPMRSLRCCANRASKRTAVAATRSVRAIRPTGASAR